MKADVERLREVGWRDEDIVHQTALFNYMVRVADGLGIDPDDYMEQVEARDKHVVDTSTWGKKNRIADEEPG